MLAGLFGAMVYFSRPCGGPTASALAVKPRRSVQPDEQQPEDRGGEAPEVGRILRASCWAPPGAQRSTGLGPDRPGLTAGGCPDGHPGDSDQRCPDDHCGSGRGASRRTSRRTDHRSASHHRGPGPGHHRSPGWERRFEAVPRGAAVDTSDHHDHHAGLAGWRGRREVGCVEHHLPVDAELAFGQPDVDRSAPERPAAEGTLDAADHRSTAVARAIRWHRHRVGRRPLRR